MKFASAILVALAACTVSALNIHQEDRWAQDKPGEACSSCKCGTGDVKCRIMTCPDGSMRNTACECPQFDEVDPLNCTVTLCSDGKAPDHHCMCPPEDSTTASDFTWGDLAKKYGTSDDDGTTGGDDTGDQTTGGDDTTGDQTTGGKSGLGDVTK